MGNLNYFFFEEYKRLDKLCGELYHDQYGISHYIDDLKNVSENGCRYIPGWKNDLEKLIRLRHIRNHLAHTEGAFNEEICTQKDIEWIQEFHRRILSQSDSLAMLYQYSKAKQQVKKTSISPSRPHPPRIAPQVNPNIDRVKKAASPTNRKKQSLFWIIVLLVIVGFLFLVILEITGLLG